MTKNINPEYRPATMPTGKDCYTVQLEFVVDIDGSPEIGTAHVVRTNNPEYANAVLATLQKWHYAAAVKNGVPVRQIVRENRSMGIQVVTGRAGDPIRTPPRGPLC